MADLFTDVRFSSIPPAQMNDALIRWGHRMGPLKRPFHTPQCHGLFAPCGRLVAVTAAAPIMRERVGGGLGHITRADSIELARLCAERPGLCRVALRLWREFVLPTLAPIGVSYQDADLHNGDTYRFDGWGRSPVKGGGGKKTDQRSGRQGRDCWIWTWPKEAASVPSR